MEIPWSALPRALALEGIGRVVRGESAERVLDRLLRANRGLSRDGRAALVQAVFGVAVWQRRLRWMRGGPADPADLLEALQELPRATATPPDLADRWSFPDWLAAAIERECGDEADAFCAALNQPGPVCLRTNLLRATRDALQARLAREGVEARQGLLSPLALIVTSERPNLFGLPSWREGWFEPQDEGSQLLGLACEAGAGDTVLDLCAGAGGKSLLLAAQGARVIAHDVDAARLERLRVRAARAGVQIAVGPPAPADVVLVDAPCSESGALRRGPDARWRIEPGRFLETQRALLEQAAPLARRRLVYATCSFLTEENEAQAARFEAAHPAFRRARPHLRTWPHRDGCDAFFAAVWDRA